MFQKLYYEKKKKIKRFVPKPLINTNKNKLGTLYDINIGIMIVPLFYVFLSLVAVKCFIV